MTPNQKLASFFEELVERVGSLPGVHGAAAAMSLPMMGIRERPCRMPAKPPLPLNERPIATFWTDTPGYFRTLGIPLRRGRDFYRAGHRQTRSASPSLMKRFARRFWPAYPAGPDPSASAF